MAQRVMVQRAMVVQGALGVLVVAAVKLESNLPYILHHHHHQHEEVCPLEIIPTSHEHHDLPPPPIITHPIYNVYVLFMG
jgi:hypothetical protein